MEVEEGKEGLEVNKMDGKTSTVWPFRKQTHVLGTVRGWLAR